MCKVSQGMRISLWEIQKDCPEKEVLEWVLKDGGKFQADDGRTGMGNEQSAQHNHRGVEQRGSEGMPSKATIGGRRQEGHT